jgi:hypothetical protein
MSELVVYINFSGGKLTYGGKICAEIGTDTKACVGGSVSTQQKGNNSITGRELLGSLETGTVKLTISDEQQVINDANKTTDEYGMMKTQSGNTYIVRGQKGKASFFKCDDLPDTAGGKYKFEITEGGKSLVVSNAKGAKKVCKLSATHE